MDMIAVTKLAIMWSLMLLHITQFEVLTKQYLHGIKELCGHTFSPNQHLMLYLGTFLHSFGLVHAWRSFPLSVGTMFCNISRPTCVLGSWKLLCFNGSAKCRVYLLVGMAPNSRLTYVPGFYLHFKKCLSLSIEGHYRMTYKPGTTQRLYILMPSLMVLGQKWLSCLFMKP